MASTSPSEFLTFYRRGISLSRTKLLSRPMPTSRPFHSPAVSLGAGNPSIDDSTKADPQHATQKKDRLDVQTDSVSRGKETRARGGDDSATSQRDTRQSTRKTKAEYPEAPDVIIGMQDERGGKSH